MTLDMSTGALPGEDVFIPVSKTSLLTAACRALENERADRIIVDDLARKLAGSTGAAMASRYTRAGLSPFVAIRTRFMDDSIHQALEQSAARQLVIVAAGMDARAFRLPLAEGTVVYELDRPELLTAKEKMLEGARPKVSRKPIGVDLFGDWKTPLRRAGFDPRKPSIWVVEGLSFFLPETAVRNIPGGIASLVEGDAWLVTDMINQRMLVNPWMQEFLKMMREDGAPWLFGVDDPSGFLGELGWRTEKILQPGDEGANFERWKYAVVPFPGPPVPRTFFITARRAS